MTLIKKTLGIVLASTMLTPIAALAQDNDEPSRDEVRRLESITVTAQKREQSIVETPVSVQVVTAETLDSIRGSDIRDLVRLSPSFQFSEGFNIAGGTPNIRGVGTAAFSLATEPSVLLVVDGIPRARTLQNIFDFIDLERVEVLRGAQGTLFGKGASAGVINVVTKAPGDELEGAIDFLVAEDGERRLRSTISGPITDKLGASLSFIYSDAGGFIDNINDDTSFSQAEQYSGRLKLQYKPTSNLEFLLTGDFSDLNSNSNPFLFVEVNNPVLADAIFPVIASPENDEVNISSDFSFTNTQNYGGDLTSKWSVAGHDLISISAYRESEFDNNGDVDGTPDAGAGGLGFVTFNLANNQTTFETFTQELRVESTFSDKIEYTAGFYYEATDIEEDLFQQLCLININCDDTFFIEVAPGFSIPGFTILNDANQQVDQDAFSFFGQGTYKVTDRLALTGGIRWQRTDFDLETTFNQTGDVETLSFDDAGVSAKAAAQYFLTDDVSLFASYSRGFKTATTNTLALTSQVVDSETSNQIDGGLKGVFFGGRLQTFVTGFWAEFDDFQAQAFDPLSATFVLSNVGEVRTRGLEVEVITNPYEGLFVNFSGSYINADIINFDGAQCFEPLPLSAALFPGCAGTPPLADLAGGDLPNTPQFSFNINANYEHPLPIRDFVGFINANLSWQDEVQFDILQNPSTIQGDYALLDLGIGVKAFDDRVRFEVFLQNVTDQNFLGVIAQNPIFGDSINLIGVRPKNADRFVGGSISYSF